MILNRELTGVGIAGLLSEFVAPSDYENALGDVTQFVTSRNTSAYLTTLQGISTISSVTRTWNPTRHNQKFMLGQMKIPVYEVNAYYEITTKDRDVTDESLAQANAGQNAMNILNLCCEQALAQRMRVLTLYGAQADEGILDNVGTFTFGNDPASNQTVQTFDTQWFARKIVTMVNQVLTNMKNFPSAISILTSINIYNYMATTFIESNKYISTGSAVTILDYVKQVVESQGREFRIGYDDTFSKRGTTNDKDYFFVNAPGLQNSDGEGISKGINSVAFNANTFKANTFIDKGAKGFFEEKNYGGNPVNGVISGNWYGTVTCGVSTRQQAGLLAELKFA